MNKFLWLLFVCLGFHMFAYAEKKTYTLIDDPIDVVIASHPKDKDSLDHCINGIRENGFNVRRIIVVSSTKLTDNAEWFDENKFPFSKKGIAFTIGGGDKKKSEEFFKKSGRGAGWYFQQLLKLYSPFVIPNISSNVLVIDADTVFLNPVRFLNDSFGGLFCFSHAIPKETYFEHAERLVPGYERVHPEVYSVCHHMLFQRPILKDLFRTVEKYHNKAFWKAFCLAVKMGPKKGASEYETYFSFAFRNTDQVQLRGLIWENSAHLNDWPFYKRDGYHFVSFHTYMKGKWPSPYANN